MDLLGLLWAIGYGKQCALISVGKAVSCPFYASLACLIDPQTKGLGALLYVTPQVKEDRYKQDNLCPVTKTRAKEAADRKGAFVRVKYKDALCPRIANPRLSCQVPRNARLHHMQLPQHDRCCDAKGLSGWLTGETVRGSLKLPGRSWDAQAEAVNRFLPVVLVRYRAAADLVVVEAYLLR